MSQSFQSQAADFCDTGYKSWYHGMTNVSIPVVNMLKDRTKLSVSVPIKVSIILRFVSVNGPRETYFVDALRVFSPVIHNIILPILSPTLIIIITK